MLKRTLLLLSLFAVPSLAQAASKPGDPDSPADRYVRQAIAAGVMFSCDTPDGNCRNHEIQHRIFYGPDRKTAITWVFGYPSDGTAHYGQFSLIRDDGRGWKLVHKFDKPLADFPAPENRDVIFLSPDRVQVTYHYKTASDPNCCATGTGRAILTLP